MENQNPPQIHFPETRQNRFRLVLATFAIALIFTWLIMGKEAPQYFLLFPGGFAFLLPYSIQGGEEVIGWMLLFAPLGWVLYISLALSVVLNKIRHRAVVLYFVFLFFLVTNVVGCSAFLG